MKKKLQELLNRKPEKWGNVSWKAFEQDIQLMQNTIREQQQVIEEQNSVIATCACKN